MVKFTSEIIDVVNVISKVLRKILNPKDFAIKDHGDVVEIITEKVIEGHLHTITIRVSKGNAAIFDIEYETGYDALNPEKVKELFELLKDHLEPARVPTAKFKITF